MEQDEVKVRTSKGVGFTERLPDFQAEGFNLLNSKEELEVRRLYDLNLKIALALKQKKADEQAQVTQSLLNDRYKAYASAYPLRKFVYEAFPIVEKGREFKNNWHIDAICELLQAATIGELKNFIINIPRRTMKSLLVCVFWQSWVWTFLPQTRWVFTSYSANFAKRDNEKSLQLIESAWYQERWGDIVHLTIKRRDKFENTAGGFRTVFKIGKGVGEGGDFVLGDDPNSIDEVESETVLERTNLGWNEVSYHNVTNRNTAVRGIIQQRTAPNDVTGFITDDPDLKKLYELLCLPMKFESDHPNLNSISKPLKLGKVTPIDKNNYPDLEIGDDKLWIDPRHIDAPKFDNAWYRKWYLRNIIDEGLDSKGDGQLLWESYITEEVVAEEVAHLKAYGEHAQFQQRPNRRGGNFFNSNLFLINGKSINPHTLDFSNMDFCRFWDKAGSDNKGDFTVGLLVGVTRKVPRMAYIIDVIRVQKSLYNRMELIKATAEKDTIELVESQNNSSYCIGIEIEPASSGKDIATIERDELLGYDVRTVPPKGSKAWRAATPKSTAEAGRLKICTGEWNNGFIARLEKFNPIKSNNKDDEIDALSGALKQLLFGKRRTSRSASGY